MAHSYNINTSPAEIAKILNNAVNAELENTIKTELMKTAEAVVEQVAKNLAASVNANLVNYGYDTDKMFDGTRLILMIDKKEVNW